MSNRLQNWWQHWLIATDEATTRAKLAVRAGSQHMSADKRLQLSGLEPRILFSATPIDPAMMPGGDETAMVAEVEIESSRESESATIATLAESTPSQQFGEIVFIDAAVPDLQQLLDDLSSSGRDAEVFVLDADRDGLDQITAILDSRSDVSSIHIVSHAEDGAVKLGKIWLGESNLAGYAGQLASWQSSLTTDADILFYGCDLASDPSGKTLIDSVSELTGADVAASTDDTGHATYGGDWELEYTTGAVETGVAFSVDVQQNWFGKLNTVTVTIEDDIVSGGDGETSLREAIMFASAGDTIMLGPGIYLLEETSGSSNEDASLNGDLDIAVNLTIQGSGAGSTTITATDLGERVFHVLSGISLDLSDVTIKDGSATGGGGDGKGGGIFVDNSGQLTLNRVIITNNLANNGGGIFNDGMMTLTDVVISNNGDEVSTTEGGGIHNEETAILNRVTIDGNKADLGGGIHNDNTATSVSLTNVTVSGNTAASAGGGLYTQNTATIVNSTFTLNTADSGGGIRVRSGTTTITNTIVAGNTGTSANDDVEGSFDISSRNNLIGDGTGSSGVVHGTNGNQVGDNATPINPILNPALLGNGGFAPTHALQTGSTAINAGTTTGAPTVDQRNLARNAPPDIGAYEANTSITSKSEFLLNTTTTDVQQTLAEDRGSQQAVSMANDGSYVVVWSSLNQDGSGQGVYARRFDATGTAVSAEIPVNQTTTNDQQWARVATASDGSFVVTWTSNQGATQDIYFRRFAANGTALTGELLANNSTAGIQTDSAIAMDKTTGEFVIAWEGEGPGDTTGIFFRRFNADGTARDGTDQLANLTNNGTEQDVSIAMNSSGDFVVVWEVGGSIKFQMFDSAGVAGTADTVYLDNVSSAPAVAMDAAGNFVVAYRWNGTIGQGVWAHKFDNTGVESAIWWRVGPGSVVANKDHDNPSIAMDETGDFIVTYESIATGGPGKSLFAERFMADTTSLGESIVNQTANGDQSMGSVAMLDLDNYVVVWTGNGEQANEVDTSGVFARQYGAAIANSRPTIDDQAMAVDENSSNGTSVGTVAATDTDPEQGYTKLYWVDVDTDELRRINLDGSSNDLLISQPDGTDVSGTRGLAVDAVGGKVYWTNNNSNAIFRADLNGDNAESLLTGLDAPLGIAVDSVTSKIFWIESGTDEIWHADLDGGNSALLIGGLIAPKDLAVDSVSGKIYWTDDGTNEINRADLDGNNVETVVSGVIDPWGIALDLSAGKVYWSEPASSEIFRADMVVGATPETVVTSANQPRDLTLDVVHGIIYWTAASSDQLASASYDGAALPAVTGTGNWPTGIAIGPETANRTYAITAGNTAGAFAIDALSGEITVANSTALDYETNPVFALTVEVTDSLGLTDAATVTINLSNVNEAPVLADASPSLSDIDEGDFASAGDSVAAMVVDGSITDEDGSPVESIAITNVDNANGTWQYSIDNGGTWSNVDDGLLAVDHALLLDGTLTGASTQKLRFVPTLNFDGNATLTFRAWDQSTGTADTYANTTINGVATAFSTATDTASITVNPIAFAVTARETIDNDADGQIDYIKFTTNQNLDDDFSGLSISVAGYALDMTTPFVTDIIAGGDNDNVFYVMLQESGTPDTGAKPLVTLLGNTSLGKFGGGGSVAVDSSGVTATDKAGAVLISATSSQVIGTTIFQTIGHQVDLVFSESLGGLPSEMDLESALTFAAGAIDADNLPSIGTGVDPLSLLTTTLTDDTIRVTFNTNNILNADGLMVGTHSVQVTDGTILTDAAGNTANTAAAATIVGELNAAPTLTATPTDPTFTEGGAAVTLFASANADTIESGQTFTNLVLTVTNVSDGADEIFGADDFEIELTHGNSGTTTINSLSYSVSVTGSTATVTLSGVSLNATELQTLIDALNYHNHSENPNTTDRVVTLTEVKDSGGTLGGGNDTATLSISSTITVNAVNDAPTLTLTPVVTNLLENTNTATSIKVADIVIEDDGSGTNVLTLTGDDALLFELRAGDTELHLKAGVSLDFESNPSLDVNVEVDDTSISGDPDHFASHTVTIGDANDAPTDITLDNLVVDENADGAVIGNVSVVDLDATDTHVWSVDDARFEVAAGQLILKTGQSLDHEAEPTVNVTITATDQGGGGSDFDKVFTITVDNVNEAPVTDHQTYNVIANNTLNVAVSGVLAGDYDPEGDNFTAVLLTPTANGSLTLNADGSFTYTPDAGFSGVDSFSYEAWDGSQSSASTSVTITVQPNLQPPPPPTPDPTPDPEPDPEPDPDPDPAEETEEDEEDESTDTGAATGEGSGTAVTPTTPASTPAEVQTTESVDEESTSGDGILTSALATATAADIDSSRKEDSTEIDSNADRRTAARVSGLAVNVDHALMASPGLMWSELDQQLNHVESQIHGDLIVVGAAGAAASSFTVGVVAWALRTGFLASGLIAQMPAWKAFDPMLVMQGLAETGDEETLQEMMNRQIQSLDNGEVPESVS